MSKTAELRQAESHDCPWPADRKHGTAAAFRYGCRCDKAREAWRLYNLRRRQGRETGVRLIDATGTVRRLQALAAMGYTHADLAPELGWKGANAVAKTLKQRRVTPGTAKRVREAYDRLCMTPGPSRLAERRARNAGLAPPLAWDENAIDDPTAKPVGLLRRRVKRHAVRRTEVDHAAVALAVAGEAPEALTAAEKLSAIAALVRRGHTDEEMSTYLGMAPRSITRIRRNAGILPGTQPTAIPQSRLTDIQRAAAA
jgi:hypothetical protein